MKLIKIMLVDDHTLFRKGLKLMIELEKDMKIIDEAKNGEDAITKAKVSKPDLIIMDINMPILNGLEALKMMKDIGLTSRVIIVTAQQTKSNIIAATKIGAKGYLFKDSEPATLINAIREVSVGRSYIDNDVANILTRGTSLEKNENGINPEKIKTLSKREYEVLALLSEGLNNKNIGKELFISEKTVKNHVTKIFKKLEVDDRVQAALFAYNNSIKDTQNVDR